MKATEVVSTACKEVISVSVMEGIEVLRILRRSRTFGLKTFAVGTYWKAVEIGVSVHDLCVHLSDAVADRGVDSRHYGDTVPKSND
ncbi:hypothetical protein F441_12164 [Phytophthora nicotianae CJ01A1]|uniref:Uncharacterized protein n=1 Tax=Phytophthora nicotianae CJ01A1 TaxID=1317063 RepID=W2WSF4_PHYNI|nr:hypothetical protein F441_12164 [Phytophthora nicotianae CJ01A1]